MTHIPEYPVCDTVTAARILGVSRQTVIRLLGSGELKGYKIRSKYMVYKSSIDKLMGLPPGRNQSYISSTL